MQTVYKCCNTIILPQLGLGLVASYVKGWSAHRRTEQEEVQVQAVHRRESCFWRAGVGHCRLVGIVKGCDGPTPMRVTVMRHVPATSGGGP